MKYLTFVNIGRSTVVDTILKHLEEFLDILNLAESSLSAVSLVLVSEGLGLGRE
jgi:hypothetical protein